MGVRSIATYPFETEWLIGEIRCHEVHKPGVIYLVHKGDPKPAYTPGYDLLPEVPRQAWPAVRSPAERAWSYATSAPFPLPWARSMRCGASSKGRYDERWSRTSSANSSGRRVRSV